MNAREKLQLSWELAFFPPRLNAFCAETKGNLAAANPTQDFLDALDDAQRLHLALPARGYASQRALERLALYQARSRAYGMPNFIKNVRRKLARPDLPDREVPPRLVRDIAIPLITRTRKANTLEN